MKDKGLQLKAIRMYMKDGKIMEQGSHKELLAKNGLYAKMYKSGI